MSLALAIFLLAFLAEIISWIGSTVLLNLVYTIYQNLFHRSEVRKHRDLKREVLATKQELLQTSAQDQFAKWAKLRRKVDKGLEDLEKLNNEMASHKTSFSAGFKTIIWVITTGSQWGIGWWYGRQAVFYLPPQWFGPATWWLSLPFAPLGSVSVGVWQMVCRRVLRVLEGIVKEFIGPLIVRPVPAEASSETATETEAQQKKEL